MKPHKCPVCDGRGSVREERNWSSVPYTERPCPACHGACVLWELREPAAIETNAEKWARGKIAMGVPDATQQDVFGIR